MKFEWIALRILLIVLAFFLSMAVARAEVYVAGDLLHNKFGCPKVDGTWKQDLITGGSNCDTGSLAWDAGLGYRFTGGESSWTKLWSVEAGYRNWGEIGVGGRWVSDEHYTEVMQHGEGWLEKHGIEPRQFSLINKLEGGYLRVAKGVDLGLGLEPYISAGLFVASHRVMRPDGGKTYFEGTVAGPTVGGGLKYNLYRGIKARIGAESHWTISENENPFSSQWITVGGGVEVPLSVFTGMAGSTRDYLWQR